MDPSESGGGSAKPEMKDKLIMGSKSSLRARRSDPVGQPPKKKLRFSDDDPLPESAMKEEAAALSSRYQAVMPSASTTKAGGRVPEGSSQEADGSESSDDDL